jgi:ubiquinone/menaquinone biosynthesis C-methylase UbiE
MILDYKRRSVFAALTSALVVALTLARALAPAAVVAQQPQPTSAAARPNYETRAVHDPNGTGKFYMGREIAQVMGPGGIPWLDRANRDEQEKPELVLKALNLKGGEAVADLGAGSGYFSFRIAPKVGSAGKVFAVEIQGEMLREIRQRAAAQGITNVEAVKGSETDPNLAAAAVDIVLMVDVYHELAFPYEVMMKIREALKPGGRVVFVEYRKEDPAVAIKEVHKMSVEQIEKEMKVIGLKHVETIETLPIQHIVIFKKN